jgi:hypothetical protein
MRRHRRAPEDLISKGNDRRRRLGPLLRVVGLLTTTALLASASCSDASPSDLPPENVESDSADDPGPATSRREVGAKTIDHLPRLHPSRPDPEPIRARFGARNGRFIVEGLDFDSERDAIGVVPADDAIGGAIFKGERSELRFAWADAAPIQNGRETTPLSPVLRLDYRSDGDAAVDVFVSDIDVIRGLRATASTETRSIFVSIFKHVPRLHDRREGRDGPDAPAVRLPFVLKIVESSPTTSFRMTRASIEFESPEATAGRLVARRDFSVPGGRGDLRVRLVEARGDLAGSAYAMFRHGGAVHAEFDLPAPLGRRIKLLAEVRAAMVSTARAVPDRH